MESVQKPHIPIPKMTGETVVYLDPKQFLALKYAKNDFNEQSSVQIDFETLPQEDNQPLTQRAIRLKGKIDPETLSLFQLTFEDKIRKLEGEEKI